MSENSSAFSQGVRIMDIPVEMAGQRIDNYLITLLKGVPKTRIYRIIRKGEVRVNKGRVKAEYRLQPGDQVRVPPIRLSEPPKQPPVSSRLAQQLEAAVLLETDDYLVLNKPSGLAVHAGSGVRLGVIEALRQMRPNQSFLELVHRLDRDTSGCLLLAKSRAALKALHVALKEKQMTKRYHALVVGRWPARQKRVDAPLRKNELKSGERIVRVAEDGKRAFTAFRVLQRFVRATLVEAQPITGRTHQIRVHAQYAGHPIIGDEKYCAAELDEEFRTLGGKRLFLHAAALTFCDPSAGREVTVEAPYDEDWDHMIECLDEV